MRDTRRPVAEELRDVMVDASPSGMLVVDAAGTILLANAQVQRLFGFDAGAIVGWPLERLLNGDAVDRIGSDDGLSRSPQPVTGRRADGSAFAAELTVNATLTSRGPVYVAAVADVSDRCPTEAALHNANRLMTLAEEMAHYGHWRVDLKTRKTFWSDEMYRIYGLPKHYTFSLDASIAAFDPQEFDLGHILPRAAVDGQPFRYETRRQRPDGTFIDVHVAGRGEFDANGTVIALFGIVHDVTERKDAEREREWSTRFQRAVLPLALPQVTGCTFDAVYESGQGEAHVGGDWYDAVALVDGRILVSIGDVSGSGLDAAIVVGVVRQIIRGIAQLHTNPMLILDAADRALCLEYPGVYVSAWIGVLDLVTRTITYASAGHPAPLVVGSDGTLRDLTDPATMLIGLRENHRAKACTAAVAHGDTLVLYTDGVTEAGRDVIAGTRRLEDAATDPATRVSRKPAEAIKRRVIPDGTLDDVAILVARVNLHEAEKHIERWRFDAFDAAAAGQTRAAYVDALQRRRFSAEDRANAEVVFGELIGNVVRHGQSGSHLADVEVVVDHGPAHSVLHVLDRGSGFHHISRLPPDPYAESGRGLFLIASLAIDFTVAQRSGGGSHARVVLRGGSQRRLTTWSERLRAQTAG